MIGMQLVEFAVSFIEAELGILLNVNTLHDGNREKGKNLVASLVLAFVIWVLNQYKLYSVFTSTVGILGIVISSCVIYGVYFIDSLILTLFYMIILYITDFFSITVFGVIFEEEQYAQLVINTLSYERIYFIVLSKILLSIIICVFMKRCLSNLSISVRKLWIGTIVCIAILQHYCRITFFQTNHIILFSWSLFLIFVLLSLYSFMQYIKYTQEKSQMYLAVERAQFQLEAYEKAVQNYLDKQIFYHDLKNHYIVIDNFLDRGEYDKAKEYMNRLKMSETGAEYRRRTGIQAVDILLDCKIKEAESYEINVSVTADLIHVGMSDQECTALIGNALDNAIEACRSMEHGVKWIRIAISRVQEMTLIKVCNSCEKVPEVRFGEFISGKQNPGLHGLGIKSMKLIVDKYGGKMKTEYSAGEFSVVILFFY